MLLALLGAGGVGAFVGRFLRFPLWPLTGAIAGAAILHVSVGGSSVTPSWWGFVAQVLVGAVVGCRLNSKNLGEFRTVMAPGSVAVVVIVGAGLGLGALFLVLDIAGPVVAFFGLVPGGVGEMVAASTALGGDGAVVAGMHLVRLLVLLAVLPPLIRWAQRRMQR